MHVILLAGGRGTRLHPLTQDLPKPMVPVVNRPWLHHLLEIVGRLPIVDIRCAVHYRWEAIRNIKWSSIRGNVPVELVVEREALGTGGAIRNAANGVTMTFMVLNADIVPGMDLCELLERHRKIGADCTIALTQVEDPSAYGVVELSPDGRILRFVEKPAPGTAPSNLINAGVYVMEPYILDSIPQGRPTSVEREIFPQLIEQGARIYSYISPAYWNDIGTPKGYLSTHWDILQDRMPIRFPDGLSRHNGKEDIRVGRRVRIDSGARLIGPVLLGDGCVIRSGAVVGPNAVLGPDVKIGNRSIVQNSVIWAGAQIGDNSMVEECIIGYNTIVEDRSTARAELIPSRGLWRDTARPAIV